MIDDLEQAAHDTVHGYRDGDRRGALALAPRVGMNATTLSNKVNPNQDGHRLGLVESIPLQLIASDFRILHAYARQLNHVCIPLVDFSRVSDVEVLTAYAFMHKEQGETAAAIHDAFADGCISRAELADIRREGFEDMAAFFELLSRLEALADD